MEKKFYAPSSAVTSEILTSGDKQDAVMQHFSTTLNSSLQLQKMFRTAMFPEITSCGAIPRCVSTRFVQDLENNIQQVIHLIPIDTLARVLQNYVKKLHQLIAADGEHIELEHYS